VGYYLAGVLAAYAAGFVITWIAGFDDPNEEDYQNTIHRGS